MCTLVYTLSVISIERASFFPLPPNKNLHYNRMRYKMLIKTGKKRKQTKQREVVAKQKERS